MKFVKKSLFFNYNIFFCLQTYIILSSGYFWYVIMNVVEELRCCSIEILKSKEKECYKSSILKSKLYHLAHLVKQMKKNFYIALI